MTIPEIITRLQSLDEIRKLTPHEVSQYQLYLSANLWLAGDKIIETEMAYNARWRLSRLECKTDKECDKLATQTPEYSTWRRAVYAEKSMVETIRALKKMLAQMSEQARNQY